jgi:hypothetical protein
LPLVLDNDLLRAQVEALQGGDDTENNDEDGPEDEASENEDELEDP